MARVGYGRPTAAVAPSRSTCGPIVLATFGVPFAAEAAELAVDAAIESGQRLIVANVSAIAILPMAMRLGYEYVETPELTEALRAPAELASAFDVPVELLRISTPRPVDALLELVVEREPSLLVLGPTLALVDRRTYRKAVRKIGERTTCLVWLAPELAA